KPIRPDLRTIRGRIADCQTRGSLMHPMPQRSALSRLTLIAGTVLVLVVVGWMVLRFWPWDPDVEDAERLAELLRVQVTVPGSSGEPGDWPQWFGPNRDGISEETGLLTEWPSEQTLLQRQQWEQKTGPGFSSMAVAGGRVYTMFQDGDREVVACWD